MSCASGLNDEARRIQTFAAPIAVTEPAAGEERSMIETGSIIPIALVYLLMVTAIRKAMVHGPLRKPST